MGQEPKKLKLSDLASWGSAFVTFLTANWALVVSAFLAIWASTGKLVFGLASNDHFRLAVQAFLIVFGTYVGIRFLASLNKPINVRLIPDYKYAINPEGYAIGFDEDNPDAAFQLGVHFRNLLNWPIKVKPELLRLTIEDRVCPDPDRYDEMIIPRIGVRGTRANAFKRDAIKDKNKGILELRLVYGDPDGEYSRRYYQKMKLYINLVKDDHGKVIGAQITDEIITMSDKAISDPI